MEITKSLQDRIVKIQNELITAIQNHQALVLMQKVSPSDINRIQIEEVQRHIICLGESQKILVTQLRNELDSQSIRINTKYKSGLSQQRKPKQVLEPDKPNHKLKEKELGRSLLAKNTNNKERERPLPRPLLVGDKRQPNVDSSSEENRTPCDSPINGNSDSEHQQQRSSVKRPLPSVLGSPSKRHKSTLQAAPRPSSPVPARQQADALSSSSEESVDSLISQHQPEYESKIDFALALGLITRDVYNRLIKKKSERRRRRVNSQHHLYNELWDLTMQKRSCVKEVSLEEADDASRGHGSPQSDDDAVCFVCRTGGELQECRLCQTGYHGSCVSADNCPACTHRIYPLSSPLVAEKKKELEQLRSNNKELHKSVSKLRERAKVLSASLVLQTSTVNQLVAKEEQLHEAINKVKNFVTMIQGSSKKET